MAARLEKENALTAEESLKDAEEIGRTIKDLGLKINKDMENMMNAPSWKSPQKQPRDLPNFSDTRHSVSTTNVTGHIERDGDRRSLPLTASESDPVVTRSSLPQQSRASSSAPNVAKILGAKLQAEAQYADHAAGLNDQLQEQLATPFDALDADLNNLYLADCSLPDYQLEPQLRRAEQQPASKITEHRNSMLLALSHPSTTRRLSETPVSTTLADAKARRALIDRYRNELTDWQKVEIRKFQIVEAFLTEDFPDHMIPHGFPDQVKKVVVHKMKKAEDLYNESSLKTADLEKRLQAKKHKLTATMKMDACLLSVLCGFQKKYNIPPGKRSSRKLHTIDENALEHVSHGTEEKEETPVEFKTEEPEGDQDKAEEAAVKEEKRLSMEPRVLRPMVLNESLDSTSPHDNSLSDDDDDFSQKPATDLNLTDLAVDIGRLSLEPKEMEQLPPVVPPLDFTFVDQDNTCSFMLKSFVEEAVEVDPEADTSLLSSRLSQSFRSPGIIKETDDEKEQVTPVAEDLLNTSASSTSRRNSLERYNEPFASPKSESSPRPFSSPGALSPQMGGPQESPEMAPEQPEAKLEPAVSLKFDFLDTSLPDAEENDLMNFSISDFIKADDKKNLPLLLKTGEWRRLILGECCKYVWSQKEANGGFHSSYKLPDALPKEFHCNQLREEVLEKPLTKEMANSERFAMLEDILAIAADLWPLGSRTSLHVPEAGQFASTKYCRDKHPSHLTAADFQAICARHLLDEPAPSFVETATRGYPWKEDVGRKIAYEIVHKEHPAYLKAEMKEVEQGWKKTPEEFGSTNLDESDWFSDILASTRLSHSTLASARLSLGRPSVEGRSSTG